MSKRLFKTMVAVLAIAAAAAGPVRGQNGNVSWVLTPHGNLQDGDTVVIVDKTSERALPNNYGTGSAPSAVEIELSGDLNAVTEEPAATLQWVVVLNNGNYQFKVPGSSNYLYCEDANNGVRVGTGSANQFTFQNGGANSVPFLKNTSNSRYIGVYNEQDWRCYTSTSINIGNTITGFYKKITFSGGGSTPEPEPEPAVPHTVTFAEGTEDVGNWSFNPAAAATNTGVTAGTVVTVKYNGTRRINSIEAMVDGPSLTTPLTIEALTAGTIVVNISGTLSTLSTGMKYAVNGGAKNLINTTTTIPVNAGDKVQFYGNGTSTTSYGDNPEVNLRGTAETKVYGNIMSLLDETGYETATAISGNYVFYALFRNNANLKDASGLLLPATTLANDCYSNMFHGCTGLTEAPALPAPTLVSDCYNAMFYGCNNLASVTCLATSGINASGSTSYWLEDAGSNVTGTKTFNAVSTATWPGNYNGIPEGWTRQDIGAQSTPEPVTLVPTGNTNEWTLTMPADNMLLMVNYAPAPVPITVRMAEGTEDAANWSLASGNASVPGTQVLENVMSGSQVTATYNGTTKKVKSVKAVKYVPPAATVATAPTATGAIIEAGSTAALVSGGVAEGGTMMYAVTTTNAQPASTADFSASVPTAEGRAAGTYYVWYYAKADADHSDSEIAGPVSVTLVAITTVTWTSSDMTSNFYAYFDGWTNNNTHQGITVTASGDANSGWSQNNIDVNDGSGTITFTSSVGNIKSIVISAVYLNNMDMSVPTGWTANEPWNNPRTLSWSGTASATVNLPLSNMQNIGGISTIVFTLE